MTAASRRAAERRRRLLSLAGLDRFSVFVPAVMSVGLLFWLVGEVREVAGQQRRRSRAKRAELVAQRIASRLGVAMPATAEERGLRPRPVYVLLGVVLLAGAAYVTVGSVANYARAGGYVSDVGWLLALSLGVAGAAAGLGVVAFGVALHHPHVPGPARRIVTASPLSTRPAKPGAAATAPSWRLTALLTASWAAFAALTLIVGWSSHHLDHVNEDVAAWVREHPMPWSSHWFDVLGSTPVALTLTLAAVLATRRCWVLFTSALGAVVAGQLVGRVVRVLTARPRPPVGELAGRFDSFPSGHLVILTLLAGIAPLALWCVRPSRAVPALRAGLAVIVVLAAWRRVVNGNHWPTDVAGSIVFGVALVASVHWTVADVRLHRHCNGRCRWRQPVPATAPGWGTDAELHRAPRRPERRRGLIAVPAGRAGVVTLAARLTASAGAVVLALLAVTTGVPSNTEATGFLASYGHIAQLGLAGLVSVAALLGWRWPAVGAVTMAVAATGLGVLASLEYPPPTAVALTAVLMLPAFLLWLSWQHRRHLAEIVVVAAVTTGLVTATWAGATTVYDRFYGPTHPASSAPNLPVDRVVWMWMGGLEATSLAVTGQLAPHRDAARVAATDPSGATVRSVEVPTGDHQVVAMHLDGLQPATDYRLAIEVDGVADTSRGVATFRTPGTGPQSFRFAVASCARTASNGAVYDQIVAQDPLFMLQLGDLHYEDLRSTDPDASIDAYELALTRPAQAALTRAVPMDHVWDDHDYGPNDAGADSPTRAAAQAAYRTSVPHHTLPAGDGQIWQAFTVGRVRIVMTDGRSDRTATTLLGEAQQRWLIDELTTASRTHALVVWANPTPWIGAAAEGADTWAGYATERREIADALAAARVHNLVMVSGDAHMVAIDDGTNSDEATHGGAGFPVLQAAALDRPGSLKGGPYSEGAHPGGGQFGLVDVQDHGDAIDVELRGMRWDGTTLVSLHHHVVAS